MPQAFFYFRYDFGLVSSQPFDDFPIEYTPRGEDKYGECLCTNFDFIKDVVTPINKLQKMFPVCYTLVKLNSLIKAYHK